MTTWCLIPNIVLYALASLFYMLLPFGRRGKTMEQTAHLLTLFGFFLQVVYLSTLFFTGVSLSFAMWLSGGLVGLFLWLVFKDHWEGVGSFFIPLALIFFLIGLTQGHEWEHFSINLTLHIIFASLSFLFMLGALLLGMVFWVHRALLRKKSFSDFSLSLPPLFLNEKKALVWGRLGFLFLTFVLLSGASLLKPHFALWGWEALHIHFALLAWIFYAIVLNRKFSGAEGNKMLLLGVLGFVSLGFSLLWN